MAKLHSHERKKSRLTNRKLSHSFVLDIDYDYSFILDVFFIIKRYGGLGFVSARVVPGFTEHLYLYTLFFTETDAWRWLFNSLLVASIITVTNVLFCSLAGYAFAKLKFPGRNTIFWLLLGTMMIPAQVTLIPVYIMVVNVFGLVDTYLAIMLPMFATVGNIFLMKQYMSTLPSTLIQAARIDGCSEFRIFRKIILPISKPGLAVLAIFTFVATWNEFFWPFLVTQTSAMRTIQIGLASFRFQDATDFGAMMAGSVVAALPMFILFFALQRYFLQGITIGAMKG